MRRRSDSGVSDNDGDGGSAGDGGYMYGACSGGGGGDESIPASICAHLLYRLMFQNRVRSAHCS
jgi:hypothetical protein